MRAAREVETIASNGGVSGGEGDRVRWSTWSGDSSASTTTGEETGLSTSEYRFMLAGACCGGGVGGGSFSGSNGTERCPLDELRGVGSPAPDADLLRDGMEGRGGEVGRGDVDMGWKEAVNLSDTSLSGGGGEASPSAMGVDATTVCETGFLRLDPDVCALRLILPSLSPLRCSSSEIVLDN